MKERKLETLPRTPRNPFQEGYTLGRGTAVIHIVVNPGSGNLTVVPTAARVKVGQQITWKVWKEEGGRTTPEPGAPYLLTFRDPAAVGGNEVRGGGRAAGGARALAVGRHNYKVMVIVGGDIHADVGCPSIKVQH